jgi:hypothetical protein
MSNTPKFSDKDVTHLVRSFEKPVPDQLRAKVMARIEQIDREREVGKDDPTRKPKGIERKGRERE